jgi:hypothetical protein
MERASLVIVNWNAGAALHACLAALFASEGAGRQVISSTTPRRTEASTG